MGNDPLFSIRNATDENQNEAPSESGIKTIGLGPRVGCDGSSSSLGASGCNRTIAGKGDNLV